MTPLHRSSPLRSQDSKVTDSGIAIRAYTPMRPGPADTGFPVFVLQTAHETIAPDRRGDADTDAKPSKLSLFISPGWLFHCELRRALCLSLLHPDGVPAGVPEPDPALYAGAWTGALHAGRLEHGPLLRAQGQCSPNTALLRLLAAPTPALPTGPPVY